MPQNKKTHTLPFEHSNETSLEIHTVFGRTSQINRIRFAQIEEHLQHEEAEEMEIVESLLSESDYKITHIAIEGAEEEEMEDNADSKTIASEKEIAVHTAEDINYYNPKPGTSQNSDNKSN